MAYSERGYKASTGKISVMQKCVRIGACQTPEFRESVGRTRWFPLNSASVEIVVLPPKLKAGDRVRFVSPASPVAQGGLANGAKVLEDLGLNVEYGAHVYDVDDTIDYLAGKDEDRLEDMHDALRDSGIKAIIATRGHGSVVCERDY
jgi:hypothetical protein